MSAALARIVPWLALAAAVVLADQTSKAAVEAHLRPGEALAVTGFFNLVLAYNRGAAFSFLAGASGWQNGLFIAVALAAAAIIVALLLRHARQRMFCAGLALILGGALGNLWDRLRVGQVVDFLDFHAFGWHFWAFNLADTSITLGAALLILDGLLSSGRGPGSRRDAGAGPPSAPR